MVNRIDTEMAPYLPNKSFIKTGNMTKVVPAMTYRSLEVVSVSPKIKKINEVNSICSGPWSMGLCISPEPWNNSHE